MHIVIFVDFHDSSVGGVQTSVRGQRKGLEALGHTVTIVSPPPVGETPRDASIITLPAVPFIRPNGFPLVAPSKGNALFIEDMLKKRSPIDIVHVQTNMGVGMLGVRYAKKHGIPLVQTMHGRDDVFAGTYPLPRLTTTLQRYVHRWYIPHAYPVERLTDTPTAYNAWRIMVNHAQAADYVVMPSHHFADKFKKHGVTKPMEVISNGISDDVVAALPAKKRPRSTVKAPLRILWCGRFSDEKRPLESIEAISRIPGCELDMFGNGPLTKPVKEYIATHDLSDRVHLRGRVDQMGILQEMQSHDVLLYPSFGFDNQPMVLIEAVAAGVPVVYCDPDLTECMPVDGALLTAGTSVDEMVTALEMLQRSPAKREKMRLAMIGHRDKIVQSYHSKKMVALYARLINKQQK